MKAISWFLLSKVYAVWKFRFLWISFTFLWISFTFLISFIFGIVSELLSLHPLNMTIYTNTYMTVRTKWWSRKILGSLPPMDTLNLQLHIEQQSLRMTWKLTEKIFHNWVKRKSQIETGRRGRDAVWLGPIFLASKLQRNK